MTTYLSNIYLAQFLEEPKIFAIPLIAFLFMLLLRYYNANFSEAANWFRFCQGCYEFEKRSFQLRKGLVVPLNDLEKEIAIEHPKDFAIRIRNIWWMHPMGRQKGIDRFYELMGAVRFEKEEKVGNMVPGLPIDLDTENPSPTYQEIKILK